MRCFWTIIEMKAVAQAQDAHESDARNACAEVIILEAGAPEALRASAVFIPLLHVVALRRNETDPEEGLRGVALEVAGDSRKRLDRCDDGGQRFQISVALDQLQDVFVVVNAPSSRCGCSEVEVTIPKDLEMTGALDGVGLDAVFDVGHVSAEDQNGRSADCDGGQCRHRSPGVAEDVAESDFQYQHVRPPEVRSTNWPSRIVNISSAWDIRCGSWVEKMKVVSHSSCIRRMRSTIDSPVCESRLAVGSSARTKCGPFTRARAMATRCF